MTHRFAPKCWRPAESKVRQPTVQERVIMTPRSVLALLLLSAGLYAQDFRATLSGTVTDPSGAAIPNATVKATNIAVNATKEAKTTSDGVYSIPYLDPGVYVIEVSATGFQLMKRTDITLEVAMKLNLPIRMT